MDPLAQDTAGNAPAPSLCWEELIVRFRGQIRGRVRRTLWRAGIRPQNDTVEELTQDVCCRLLGSGRRKLSAFRGHTDAELVAYLGRAAERIVLDQLRAARAQKRGGHATLVSSAQDAEQIADRAATPEDALLAAEESARLVGRWHALLGGEAADREQLEALRLALEEGWTSAEISRLLEHTIPAKAVEHLLRKMRRQIREWSTRPAVS
jgi:RNA polymerase sigma factor (sigma-70 family)